MSLQHRVILSAGHDPNIDPGAVGQGTTEATENIQITNRVAGILQGWGGLEVVVEPHNLGDLVSEINWVNARYKGLEDALSVQIHKNSGGGHGTETWFPSGGDDTSRHQAQTISNAVAAETGMPNRGIKDSSTSRFGRLGWNDDTNTYAVLVECGFIDSDPVSDDADQKYAMGVAKGIMQIFGVNIPTPAPVVHPEPAPAPEPAKPVENPYTLFKDADGKPQPMQLVANKQPTNVYDVTKGSWAELSANIVKQLNLGDPFVAVGKYKHPLGGVYFMTEYSFGQADVSGTPAHPYGINTVDLSPAPSAPVEAAPVQAPTPVETPSLQEPVQADDGSVTVPVTVIPVDPNKKWQDSFVSWGHGDYIATQSIVVKDISGANNDLQLIRGQNVKVAGQFVKDGVTYYRTDNSAKNGKWYGIPVKANNYDTLTEDDNIFSSFLADEIAHEVVTIKDKAIKTVASIDGFISRPFHKK